MIQEVVEIVDPSVKTGVGKLGEWTQAKVKLKNGEEVRVFQPIEVGDMVEAFQNGEYTNWKLVKEPTKRGLAETKPPVGTGQAPQTEITGFTQKDRDMLVEIHAQIVGVLGEYDG